jgi:penicillin-binding protein 1A
MMIDPATGLRAYPDQKDAIEEVFVAGTEPKDVASPDAGAPDAAAPEGALPDAGAVEKPGEAPPPF